jgi:hypothetical protein
LDSRGEPPTGLFGIDGEDYKLTLKDSAGATVWTVDDIRVPIALPYLTGVTGDGVADDTAAIQAALDALSTNGSLIFPPGIYLISSALTMTGKDDVSIFGQGATIKEASGVLTEHFLFTSCDRLRIDGFSFSAGEDETYFDANTPSEERQFIDLVTCNDAKITNLYGANKRRLLTALTCPRIIVDGYSFSGFLPAATSPNANGANAPCVTFRGCDYAVCTNGTVTNHGSAFLSQLSSAYLSISNIVGTELHDNGVYVSSGINISISGCSFLNIVGDGIQVRGENFAITGNVCENCDDLGISATPVTGAASSYSISGNTVRGCELGIRVVSNSSVWPSELLMNSNIVTNTTSAIDDGAISVGASATGRIAIVGNVVRTFAGDNGIFIGDDGSASDHIVISANIVSDINGSAASTRGAIRVEDATEVCITGNLIDDIASGVGVRLKACIGGVVSGNLYEGGQVVRIAGGEGTSGIAISGNRGATIAVDPADVNRVFKNDAVVTGFRVITLADDATPSVLAGELFKTGGTTAITDFDDGEVGQTIKILAAHSVTITDGAPIILNGGANFDMVATDTLTLTMFDDQVWQEVSRSVN